MNKKIKCIKCGVQEAVCSKKLCMACLSLWMNTEVRGEIEYDPEDTRTNSDKLDALEKKMDENFKKIIDMLVDTKKELVDMLERLEIRN